MRSMIGEAERREILKLNINKWRYIYTYICTYNIYVYMLYDCKQLKGEKEE
jgi:hypothetical protein